jgi:hypothetical protein
LMRPSSSPPASSPKTTPITWTSFVSWVLVSSPIVLVILSQIQHSGQSSWNLWGHSALKLSCLV